MWLGRGLTLAHQHVTAVTVATKGKLDLSMAVAVGSSIQISLFVIPFLVLLGWCIGQPLSFYFGKSSPSTPSQALADSTMQTDPFETLVLFVSIVSVCWAIQDGRTQWLEVSEVRLARPRTDACTTTGNDADGHVPHHRSRVLGGFRQV